MINFWALILVALPLLTSSQAVLSANQWRDLYNRIQQEAKSPGFPLAYVCCNQPPTPLPRKPRSGFAPLMSKRGDQYTLLKRFYDDFGHQAQQPDTGRTTDEDDAILSADIAALALTGSNSRSVSRASRQDSLLRRLLDGARTRSVLESLTRDGGDGDSMRMNDYPEKRGTFVRPAKKVSARGSAVERAVSIGGSPVPVTQAPGSPGGANLASCRNICRHCYRSARNSAVWLCRS